MADGTETGEREQELVNVIDAIEEAVSPSSSPQKKLNNRSSRKNIRMKLRKYQWFRKVSGRR